MDAVKIDEEKLREAACYGDLETVQILVAKGVNVNAQHSINGWTPLHWAAKRNQIEVFKYLLSHGADPKLPSSSGELPMDLTSTNMMENSSYSSSQPSSSLPITPSYMTNPSLSQKVEINHNSSVNSFPKTASNTTQNLPNPSSVCPAELVLKLRICDSPDLDYIEIEIPHTELTYDKLFHVCCEELGLNPKYIERLRKLPNTVLRKDKDVQRLQDFQEIEVVLISNKVMPTVKTCIRRPSSISSNPTDTNGYQSISAFKNQTILY